MQRSPHDQTRMSDDVRSVPDGRSSQRASLAIATIILDRALRITHATPRAHDIFRLRPSDTGRPHADSTPTLGDADLLQHASTVLRTGQAVAYEVGSHDTPAAVVHVVPSRTRDDRIDGVVLTYVDLSACTQAEQAVRAAHDRTAEILESISDAFYAVDATFTFTYVNQNAAAWWGRSPESLLGTHYGTAFLDAVGSESYHLHHTALAERRALHYETYAPRLHRWIDVHLYPNAGGGLSCYFHDITARKQRDEALRVSEERLRLLVETATEYAIILLDNDGRVNRWNPGAERHWGYTEAEMLGRSADLLFTPEDQAHGVPAAELRHARAQGQVADERWHVRKDGSRFYASGVMTYLDHHIGGYAKIARDLTAHQQMEAALRQSEARYRTLFTSIDEGFCIVDVLFDDHNCPLDARVVDTNPAFTLLTGVQIAAGTTVRAVVPALEPDWFDRLGTVALTGTPVQFEQRIDALHQWFAGYATRVGDDGSRQVAVVFNNITARKQADDALQHQARHDALTGLPNRAAFLDHVGRAIARHQRHPDYHFAVLFLDLDRFKRINDSLGHAVGDQLLITTAQRVQQCVRPQDVVARLGGDEFVVLLDGIHAGYDAYTVTHRIQATLATPLVLDGHAVTTTTSIGITLSDVPYTQPEDLLRDADTAMYRAKRHEPGRHAVFDRAMHTQVMTRLRLESELHQAVERQEFRLHYQPIVTLATGALQGFEALVRWHHPTRGLLAPDVFIPVAEETGLIHALGRWALHEACGQMQRWHTQWGADAPASISVNLSAVQCRQPDLVGEIAHILHTAGLSPQHLRLEITESAVLEHTDAVVAQLDAVRALGVQLTLDDFGTGYSSLSYLHRFPIGTVKVDRAFVHTLADRDEHGTLVRSIVMLAQNLGLEVVAEGVETAAQHAQLVALGCGYGQGYLFGRPMDAAAAGHLVARAR